MANAGFGLPFPYTIAGSSGSAVRPWSNVQNDEPGLVFQSGSLASFGSVSVSIDISAAEDVSFLSVLGFPSRCRVWAVAFTSHANRSSGTGGVTLGDVYPLSSNRSSAAQKHLMVFAPTSRKYLQVLIYNAEAFSSAVSCWRLLVGKWVEPSSNIEVSPKSKIDDRQLRRYSSTGRRNFLNAGVYPAFSGQWPWISETEFKTLIKPMTLKYGASVPVLFCLDYGDTDWGEDGLYYGDLEKDQEISHDDGQLYTFAFSIVDIAPVA